MRLCTPARGLANYPWQVPQKDDPDDKRSSLSGSAFARTARLASLPVGFAGRTTLGMGKRLVGVPANAVLTEVQQRTADQVFKVLGELKGGAMKFGQAMSIFESALPDELIGPYRETLTKLQDGAPPMPPRMVDSVMSGNYSGPLVGVTFTDSRRLRGSRADR